MRCVIALLTFDDKEITAPDFYHFSERNDSQWTNKVVGYQVLITTVGPRLKTTSELEQHSSFQMTVSHNREPPNWDHSLAVPRVVLSVSMHCIMCWAL